MIAGVLSHEIKNVVIRSGVLTELYRPEWFAPFEVRHAVHMAPCRVVLARTSYPE